MKVTTYSNLRQNLASMLDSVHNDHEPLLVTRGSGNHAVVMSLEDFTAYQETLYLNSSKKNARRLKESIEQIKTGQGIHKMLDELDEAAK
jgi:antitoxin YefM